MSAREVKSGIKRIVFELRAMHIVIFPTIDRVQYVWFNYSGEISRVDNSDMLTCIELLQRVIESKHNGQVLPSSGK